jgi:hypothetical protein
MMRAFGRHVVSATNQSRSYCIANKGRCAIANEPMSVSPSVSGWRQYRDP